jgi:hypothetical protein
MWARNRIKSIGWTWKTVYLAVQLKNNKEYQHLRVRNGKKFIHRNQQKSKTVECSQLCKRKINLKIVKEKGAN